MFQENEKVSVPSWNQLIFSDSVFVGKMVRILFVRHQAR